MQSFPMNFSAFSRASVVKYLVYDSQQMRNFIDHAAHRRAVLFFHDLIQFCDTQAPDDRFLFGRITDRAAVILDLDLITR